MYPQSRPPQQDALAAVILYLSRLDHGRLYSDDELARAMNDCYASFGSLDTLSLRYGRSLSSEGTEARARRERRAWASRVAADLARRHPHARSVPIASGTTLSAALEAAGVPRRARAAHRRALLAGAPVIALYLLISGSANAARDFMALPVAGPLNVGLGLGLLQLVAVAAWVLWYGRYSETSLDPLLESLGTSTEELRHRS
ncbi:DUF485 domain-containing protein [Streptomyces dysideae]|uniref:DUF485 domain-containing protein n=1 Tax=Streptomyces dysideae TaxID=909626 RepID=A0A101UR30_9ACTN|nr:DUF485 domain-containing protein [Streptomyces dysideae]KUO15301.1 hypothetical protein AQJ91_42155 [Streptomyces dysideae]